MEEVLIVQNISKKFKLSRKQMKISGELLSTIKNISELKNLNYQENK